LEELSQLGHLLNEFVVVLDMVMISPNLICAWVASLPRWSRCCQQSISLWKLAIDGLMIEV
jgi:hypothetical protein